MTADVSHPRWLYALCRRLFVEIGRASCRERV